MKRVMLNQVLLCLLAPLCYAADSYGFPEFRELPAESRIPQSVKMTIDRNGDILIDGQARYLSGMQIGSDLISDLTKVKGTPESLGWFYDEPLDYESAQRLGFDTLSLFNINRFVKAYHPSFWKITHQPPNLALYRRTLSAKLPFYLDFTEFPWANGCLSEPKFRDVFPEESVNRYRNSEGNHWVAYNVNHPEEKKRLRRMLEDGVLLVLESKTPVIAYELYNEPAYDDPSPYNRRLFADFLKVRYKTPDAMNRLYGSRYASFEAASNFKYKSENPGLFVDWSKFMENSFTNHVKFGFDVLRNLDPDARATVQIMGMSYYRILPKSNINMYEISKILNAVTVPTGGGISLTGNDAPTKHAVETPLSMKGEGILMRHVYRALAEGKPLINSELYTGNNRKNVLSQAWLDHLRGCNASYFFSWSKRGWEWGKATPQRIAEKFPWMILNPWSFKPEDMLGFMDVKKETLRFREFFASRDRGIPRETAVLLSYPTERYAGATGYVKKNDVTTYASALDFSHYPIDAVLEEMLPEGRAGRYKAIVAVGTRNIYPSTVPALKKFVADGGILILAREFMPMDEYGHAIHWNDFLNLSTKENPGATQSELKLNLPQAPLLPGRIPGRNTTLITSAPGWDILGTMDGHPAVLRKKSGKGFVYVITPEMQDYPVAAVLGAILPRHGIHPSINLRNDENGELAVNVEAHVSKRGNRTAIFLFNHDNYPKLVRLSLRNSGYPHYYDLIRKMELPMNASGAAVLLPPNTRAIVGNGPANSFGTYPAAKLNSMKQESAEILRKLRSEKKEQKRFSYSPDLSRTSPLNLRAFCNRGFIDSVSNDGKGGWTDQGAENSLEGVPWGIHKFGGVPCEIIRFDQNENKTCLVLASKSQKGALPAEVKDIPVNKKVKALYFFHTAAWFSDSLPALTYRICYADGSVALHEAVCGKNIFDWWIRNETKQVAWMNRAHRGFQVDRWENPHPEKEVRSIDLISANNRVVPIVIGITVEEVNPDFFRFKRISWTHPNAGGFGGVSMKKSADGIHFSVSDKTGEWSGANFGKHDVPVSPNLPGWDQGFLVFEICGGPDRFGNPRGNQQFQMVLSDRNRRTGKTILASGTLPLRPYLPGGRIQPDAFSEVRIPLSRFSWKKKPQTLNSIMLQYRGSGKESGGFTVRNIRFELPIP